jgi:hypothetical protein
MGTAAAGNLLLPPVLSCLSLNHALTFIKS